MCLTRFRANTHLGYYADSANPVQMPQTDTTNGLIQMIKIDKSTSQKRAKEIFLYGIGENLIYSNSRNVLFYHASAAKFT